MAKFRFPGKALKLNTRKRVRFRGSHATNTPEELYTRRIRKGLDLFTQIFGDSDEDEDDFEGFSSSQPEARVAGKQSTVPPRSRAGKRTAAQKAEACLALEEAGLATVRRTSVVEGAVSEVREGGRTRTEGDSAQKRVAAPQEPPVPEQDPSEGPGEECVQGTKTLLVTSNRVTRRQTNHRISRPPTVKTALAKKLLAKAKKKVPSLPVVGEKSPKRFILPTMSVRSSRIIKPNKRLFADITEICSPGGPPEASPGAEAGEGNVSVSPKRLVKLTRKGRGSHTQFLSLPRSRAQDKNAASGMEGVRRTISIYTEAMTGPCKGQVGRPPKRLLRRVEAPQQEVEAEAPDSPQRCDPKESRVKEKIEKLLRSPWDNRLKQTAKSGKGEGEELMPAPTSTTSPVLAASTLSRNILRRPRLNLNKTTLQRLRNPTSLQRFIPACDGGSVEGKCAVCDIAGEHFLKFGILFCEMCSSFLDKASAGPKEVMECLGGKGECQVQGLEVESRCPACWLYRVLTSCSISNILHDHLRKRLPAHLKDHVPTSLARCMNVGNAAVTTEKDDDLAGHMKRLPLDPGGGGAFGSVIDLPGGWRRKTGPEVIVISPSGEKFRSIQKLEEFLKKQGIRADARVLFGNSSPAVGQMSEVKSKPSAQSNSGSRGKVVMTTLPGGWTRRIKWRSAGDRFDTYVYSPDGRTFRSRRELSSYFSLIGKVDDIHKYFPVVTGHSDASIPSSSDTPGSSSTEPVSSSEPCSEVSSDDKSPEASEREAEQRKHKFRKPSHLGKGKKSKISQVKPLKVQEKAGSKLMTKLSVVEESVEEADHQDKALGPKAEANTLEFRQKQKVPSRSRTHTAGRKDDTSLTDTTESESEQRKPETIQIFSKTFSRSRSRKSKQVVSPPLFGNNSSSVCSPQLVKDKAASIPQETLKDNGDGSNMSTTVDTGDVKLSGKKQKKTQEEVSASPEPFTVLPESGDKESSVLEDGRNTSAKVSVGKRLKRAAEQVSASPESGKLSVSDGKVTTKIVLKIPKKAITIKPIRKKMKNRSKHIKNENHSDVKEERQTSKLHFLEDKSWETKPPTDTKKLSDVTQGKLSSQEGGEEPAGSESDGLANYDMTDKSRVVTSPSMSEGEGGPQPFRVPVVKKVKPQKSKKYETQHFGQGWTRRIRWNDRGEGRVALLYSPDGQTFRSRIELSAYFKKACKPRVDLNYYFPLVLHKAASAADKNASTLVTSTSTQSSESSEFSDSDAFVKTSEDSWGSGEETRRSRLSQPIKHYHRMLSGKNDMEDIVEEVPLPSYQNSGKPSSCLQTFQEDGRKLMPLPSKGGKNIVVSIHEVKRGGGAKSETEEGEELLDEAGGPRVKHVCRSQAQVMRITRAVFPSPKKEEDQMSSSVVNTKPKAEQKRKIVTVTTTASGKVLRKTQWCGKCPGCTTPNCLKCSNCLDMKKYGGPGTKKKPCIKRKCQNPRLSIKSAGTQEVGGKATLITTSTTAATAITTTVATALTANSHKDLRKVSLLNLKVQEEKLEGLDPESDSTSKSLEQEKGGVFIPRQMTRIQPDQKDRGDIAAGKQFVPSALVNIDYWQGYDADEMMLTGYPVTTASPLHPQILCFRCGSLGKEQLLYCAWCCEGIHPYCLEDGEGPESEAEEVFWICRRCAVCHVCGAPGADSLLRCSDCRNYYHLECLGPSAHSTCQPTPDRPWKCVTCTRCSSCGSPNVARWQKTKPLEVTLSEGTPTAYLALCLRCATLRERGNFCPLCNGCYEDDDYEAKMMECGRCREWVHAHCEGLNNERYQILSFLPDTVEYVCCSCMVDSTSSWLDAVSSELLAGCEAVLQALLNSKCARHLQKRDTSTKLSSSGVLTPLPFSGTPTLDKTEEGPLERVEEGQSSVGATGTKASAESPGYQPVALPFLERGTSTEGGVTIPATHVESVCESAEVNHAGDLVQGMEVDSSQGASRPTTESMSGDGTLLGTSLSSAKDISQGEAVGLKPAADQTLDPVYIQTEPMAANSNAERSGCVDASDKTDLKEKSVKEKSEEEVQLLPRRQTRSCTAVSAPAANPAAAGVSTDPIRLKECSVRLEDICKSKSPASSPVKSKPVDQDGGAKTETPMAEEVGELPQEPVPQKPEDKDTKVVNKEIESVRPIEEKEPEGLTREALQSLLPLSDTGVSCTQVDGPNDETTATSRVMRNLFLGDRNQMMLETTGLLDGKTNNTEEKSLAQVEAQIISPKDKITKDIDDDCVSSEESSSCDTDTEIESIQDDPEEPRDLYSVKDKLKEKKYESVLQFHVDMVRIIENGRHLNRSQIRNVQATYAKHMKECFPWFDVKTANVFDLVDKQRPFPVPHLDHNYIARTLMSGSRHFTLRDAPIFRKRSTSPVKWLHHTPPDRRKCVLCGREGDDDPNSSGRLLYLGQDEWLHVNCGLWSSEVYEEVDGGLQNVYLAVNRGRLIKCSACLERGATVGCCHKSCQATYHFMCARRACCQFMEDKRIFCPQHESVTNGAEKSDDFKVSRCVYVDMDCEKKKWKQVAGNRVSITLGALTIKNLGRIVPESDSSEALIPVDFVCSRLYWSTVDPTRQVTYTCRTRRVVPTLEDASLLGDAAFHKTIDHSLGEDTVHWEMAAVKKWFKQLEERKVEKKSRETNIIPPHLCPLYRGIREKEEEAQGARREVRCRTPPAMVVMDVRQCIDDIIDKVSRSVEEESLLLETDLPAIGSYDDNELISMVLNDLDGCDPITLESTPSTSGRPSPLDIDFLSTCDHMMDSGKVTHSGNMTQEAQETDCDPQVIMDTDAPLTRGHDAYQGDPADADVKESILQTLPPPPTQNLSPVPPSSATLPTTGHDNIMGLNKVSTSNDTNNAGNSCNSCNKESKNDSGSSSSGSSSSGSSNSGSNSNNSSSSSNSSSSNSSSSSSTSSSSSSSSSSSNGSSSSSSGSSSGSEASCIINPTLPGSSPERCSDGTVSNNSSPESVSRGGSDHNTSTDTGHGSTDTNSGSETSSQGFSIKSPGTSASGKTSSSLKQICRVLPMPSTNSRRSSSTSDHSDFIPHGALPPQSSQHSPRHSDENEGTIIGGKSSERKKICMKRNYRTVIKKYPLRSGMRKSKPYETVQIEINETIEIPGGEGPGMVHKSLKRKWSGILDSEEEEEEESCQKDAGGRMQGQDENVNPVSDGENSKENAVSKKVLKFSDDNNDITVSIVNNNNNLCEFSKSRGHRYRHKTVLQLDGAADGSSSSAEMSESQDEGTSKEKTARSHSQEDPQTPPLHSSLAMRIKEQSLARSSPGEEGPYKCSKCKRLYRTKESCEKHIETCTFEVDSSSTSDEDEEYEDNLQSDEDNKDDNHGLTEEPLSPKVEAAPSHFPSTPSVSNVEEFLSSPPELSSSQHSLEGQEISLIGNLVSNIEQGLSSTPLQQMDNSKAPEFPGAPSGDGEEPAVKKQRLDPALPRQPGVHRQVRTAIKKSPGSGEDVELLGVVRGPPPPGTDVFVPPPVSPVKFSPIVKKSASPRRYTNIRLMRGNRGYQYRRAPPHMPTQEQYHGAASSLPLPPTAPAPIQVTMHPMANTSGQILTQGTPPFQQFGSQSTQYTPAAQLTSTVTHLSPALQVGPQVTQVAPQVSPQVSPLLTMVSTPSVAVPQGYTLQYVGSFRDGEMASGGSSLVTYPAAPVVVPQPQLVMTPQQSSVVMPQVVNTNITYSFTSPDTLVINQPTVVPGMQPVQYLTQQQHQQQSHQPQQQQQTQVLHHPEHQQVAPVMQYSQTGVSPQHTQMSVSHMHNTQVHAPCIQLSDLQANPVCLPQQQQAQPAVVSRELSFGGSKQVPAPQGLISSPGRGTSDLPLSLSATSTIGTYSVPTPRPRPQASVAPQVIRPQPVQTTASQDSNLLDTQAHSRIPFADRPLVGGVRTVATVAPAIITTSVVSISTCSMATKLTSVETTPKIATVRPRPTYSYRDAMREKQMERQKQRQEIIQINQVQASAGHPEFLKEQEGSQVVASDSESDSENENTCPEAEKEDRLETQSYKLVLRKDSTLSSGFNVLPISGPTTPLPAPEVKELRIKAKVSVGPKRKKTKNRDPEKDLIIVNKDTTNDLYVNEQLPNLSLQQPVHTPSDDPALFDKPKTCSTEPYIVFELTSDDGFQVESRHISEVWQKVFDAVAAARASMRVDSKMPTNLQQPGPGGAMSGLHMLGLTHNAVQYLLEQLPGAKDCHKYSFQFHRRPQEEGAVEENPSGCARTEAFKTRSPYDIFSWLASKHRRMPERSHVQQEEIQLSTRRATSLELPMAMRYRHLRETAREAVGVFRSNIHGRGLFCKRDIDAGEMVIEYAGQVIRSSMCDMREKDYESKGIGCYMFRIDDDTVIDATMHGNAARFINHSCDPNCYSRVVDILGKKHIIIFALRRILRGEELTYDYKFPIEEDKIPCTCGTRRCRKYLN